MTSVGIHRGFLRKYGGFMFKQWKEKYLVLTVEGSLLVCRDADSAADQVVALQGNCESIVEGREILDLPRLPPGGRRDCCFALILRQDKFLLLLSDSPDDCSQWLKLLRKVREGVTSPMTLQRQQSFAPCITDRDPLPDPPLDASLDKDSPTSSPRLSDRPPASPRLPSRDNSFREKKGPVRTLSVRSGSVAPPHRSADCLRHGNSSDARAVRAVCLLMGGAAATSALGYLNSCAVAGQASTGATGAGHAGAELGHSAGFSELGGAGSGYHACGQAADGPHFNSFDFEGDSDFDAFDCGGFAF
ncbi:hypothetical protein AALO_G00206350 [Alosa alosa]|uniref:PH domain-containing protein n=1 Tax=Alosa alosa TaxID=278164 RepID=A0AAV6G4C4_9TELE|nr:uncharacterized protein si:ch1073-83n3.2 [Alosa alosa]KAG5269805.1 hypothetical protein AALO_G00206350 [Alosa alosa]